jgi:hypothetical protein
MIRNTPARRGPGALLAGALLLAALPLHAEAPVPIHLEPMHRLVFSNAHVRFFDVRLPPGYRSLMHVHQHDGVFVNIAPAVTVSEDWGAEPVQRPPRIPGEAYFIGYADAPKAHRVSNAGETEYRVTDTEILSGCGAHELSPELSGDLVVENRRVRVTRLMLAPHQSVRLHGPCGMLVSVSGGAVVLDEPGAVNHLALEPGGFSWRQSHQGATLTNVGSEPFHAVDILVKP